MSRADGWDLLRGGGCTLFVNMPATTTVALPTESEIMHTKNSVDGGVRDGNGQMPARGLRQSRTTHRRVAVQPDRPLLPTVCHFASLTSGLGVKGLGGQGFVADGMTYRCHPGEAHDRADMVWVFYRALAVRTQRRTGAVGKGGLACRAACSELPCGMALPIHTIVTLL
jgi:hypothetical protein